MLIKNRDWSMYDELKTNLLIEQKGVYNIWNIQRKKWISPF
ncbi:hypothetical protein BSM4216_1379 [Bacillus smithii]|nr:hypothetical protein BSM4216_1379 [Bacillus smithii]